MEHVKRALENIVAQESLKLESGLILLAIAVSGAPFMGLLGTVWGVMSTFGRHRAAGRGDDGGNGARRLGGAHHDGRRLLVAIPSMFGYNWLVHNLRVFTVNLDNFARNSFPKWKQNFWRTNNFYRHAQIFPTQLPRDVE